MSNHSISSLPEAPAPEALDANTRSNKDPEKLDPKSKHFIESDAGDGSNREDQYLHGVKLVLCFVAVFACMFLVALDQTIVVTLLTVVGSHFNGFSQVGWLSSGFLLSMSVLGALWGKLSIIFGRKAALLIAILLFEAGSLMCALASSMNVLIGGRVFAGVGGGGIAVLVFVVISEIFPIEKRPLSMGLMGCTFAIASVLGPLIGGAFTDHVSWRWCFYINLPIGGLAAAFLFVVFNPPKSKGNFKEKLKMIDYFGTFLMVVGLVLLLLGLTFGSGNQYKWNSAAVICCFVIGGVVFLVFCVWNYKFSKNPVVPPEVVVIPQVMASSLTLGCTMSFFISSMLYLAIYFQVIHGQDALKSGILTLPMIIPLVISSISGGGLIHKTKFVKPFSVGAAILSCIGTGLLCLLEVDSSSSKKIGLLIVVGVGVGFQMQASIMSAQISAPKTPGGTILTVTFVNFLRSLGGALAGDLADVVYNSTLGSKLPKAIANAPEDIAQELAKVDIAALKESVTIIKTLSPAAQNLIKQQIMLAIKNVFYMGIAFAGLSLIFSLFVTNHRLPSVSVGANAAKKEEDGEGEENKVAQEADDSHDHFDGKDTQSDVSGEVKHPEKAA